MATEHKHDQDSYIIPVPYRVDGKNLTINQHFHKNCIPVNGQAIDEDLMAVAQEIHKELYFIAETLGIEYGSGRDPNLEMLCACREIQKTRIIRLKNVLISMGDGTFTFKCQKSECPKYDDCPIERNLRETRKAVPEATACKWFREQQTGVVSRPHGKRHPFF